MTISVEIHALQTLPPSNINRDETGAPKSAVFGGVIRQRVSSQAWKRAIREDFRNLLPADQLGIRTKQVVDLIAKKICKLAPEWESERAQEAAAALFRAAKIKVEPPKAKKGDAESGETRAAETGYLFFLSERQIDRSARFLIEHPDEKIQSKDAKALLDREHSVDIAMFGRMIADAADMNVDAAVQVAHAIGVHESEPEVDFFTAVDDVSEENEESGAGMLGTVQMMSSTLYRYAAVNLDALRQNLANDEIARAATVAFVQSFIRALPTGKLNTFANWTLPELVYVTVSASRPISLVNAFEEPAEATSQQGRREVAAAKLAQEARAVRTAYEPELLGAWVVCLGTLGDEFGDLATSVSQQELLAELRATLEQVTA